MDSDILGTFRWEVSVGGYRIIRAGELPRLVQGLGMILNRTDRWPNPDTPVVTAIDPLAPIQTYSPFARDHSALFREFARRPLGSSDILRLANRYGLLRRLGGSGIGEGDQLLGPAAVAKAFESLPPEEQAQVKLETEAGLKQIKALRLPPHLCFDFEPVRDWTELADALARVLESGGSEPLGILDFLPKRAGDVVNRNLAREEVGHRLFWLNNRVVEGPVPRSLAGAIWLQVAFSFSRQAEYRTCANESCRRPFEVAAGLLTGKRANAIFCSQACKSQDYRRRRAQARELARKGILPGEIAKSVVRNFKKSPNAASATALVKSWTRDTGARRKKGGS
jgi:hypothetical protein